MQRPVRASTGARVAAAGLLAAVLTIPSAPAAGASGGVAKMAAPRGAPVTLARELHAPVRTRRTFRLRRAATHLAVHWRGGPRANVRVALGRDGGRFGRWHPVVLDEIGEQRPGRRTYGAVMPAHRAREVRVAVDRRLRDVAVVAFTDRGTGPGRAVAHASSVTQPAVISRAGWGADESLRFDSNGNEVWPPVFQPVQKLIVHHTATKNDDPDPAATIRSIYHYHAVTQGWGDIGYNFLVDEAGNVYEGRHARTYAPGEVPTGEDPDGNGVTAAHASGYNSGTVGIALLGTLTSRDAAPAARDALERMLAWKAERHGIDPHGSDLYTNPVSGEQRVFANIAGHRDVNATECPGDRLYAALPGIRDNVAALMTPDAVAPAAPTGLVASPGDGSVALDWSDNAEMDLAGYDVYRAVTSGGPYERVNATRLTASAYADSGLVNGTTYHYVVTASDAAGNQSAPSQEVSVQPAAPPIELTATGYRSKGRNTIDLLWSGAATQQVDVWRNGVKITTTANDGMHTDATRDRGGATYRYRVCEEGTATCSAERTVVF